MKSPRLFLSLLFLLLPALLNALPATPVQLKTADGILEGVVSGDGKVRTFKGIPYAAPPVGPLRWQPPQPVAPWTGVRPASEYGPRAMQGRIFDDMVFHDAGPSEDCLYLNLWMPAKPATDKLPVMVWIHGGGFVAGSSSEPRQDAGNLSKQGVLVVSMNYRMGIFGFFSLPELTQESPHHASGNYGLLDIVAALQWVKKNIATFGGDPDNVTIFGESAGSSAVSALMASPLAHGLFHKAIGESGSILNAGRPQFTLAQAEEAGVKFAETAYGTSSLAKLRALSAQELLDPTIKPPRQPARVVVDGWFLPQDGVTIFAAGRQARVPLLAGWNLDEGNQRALLENDPPTLANFQARAQARFGDQAGAFLRAYAATTDAEAKRAAKDFGGDQFTGYATWKWIELHRQTGGAPVWRYKFEQTLPLVRPDAAPGADPVAPHASEIEYVFQVLSSRKAEWQPEHRTVSNLMAAYWTNFAKTGNPNGPGLPEWPAFAGTGGAVMHFNSQSAAAPETDRARYEFIETMKR